jgi:hypothetical protein
MGIKNINEWFIIANFAIENIKKNLIMTDMLKPANFSVRRAVNRIMILIALKNYLPKKRCFF